MRSQDDESTPDPFRAIGMVYSAGKAICLLAKREHSNLWHEYIYLRGVRQENRDLKDEIEQLRLEQVRLSEDAEQARRLQNLLGFKEQFIQDHGRPGHRLQWQRAVAPFYIDKGSNDGISEDMAVITADGVVGKVLRVYESTSQVLLINDQTAESERSSKIRGCKGCCRERPPAKLCSTRSCPTRL